MLAYVQDFFFHFRRLYRQSSLVPPPSPLPTPASSAILVDDEDSHGHEERSKSVEMAPEEDDTIGLKCIYSRTVAKLLYTGITGCLGKAVVVQFIPDWGFVEQMIGVETTPQEAVSHSLAFQCQ